MSSPAGAETHVMESCMKSETLTVLVTAIGGGGHGEQILKALRTAPHSRYRIIGADASPHCPQFNLVDQGLVLPKANDPDYIDAVLEVCRVYGVEAVFHGCEPELRVMSKERGRFAAAEVFLPINPAPVIDTCMDKAATAKFLLDHGFEPPRFLEVGEGGVIPDIDWYPVVIKPSLGGGGSWDCYIAQNRRQLEIVMEYLQTSGRRLLVQEYVGSYQDEFTVGILSDMEGNFLNSIALKRNINSALNMRLTARNTTGRGELGEWLVISSGISHGYIGQIPDVTEPCERISAALGCRGAVNIQCRLVDGEVRVFEINPRFSGTTSIRAMMGYNEPDVLIRRHLLGENIPPRFPYRSGVVLRSLAETEMPSTPVPKWDEAISGTDARAKLSSS
jgi:carbamoyl-phosphate synthase large subunit